MVFTSIIAIEEPRPLESHYDTRKILGETRYRQKQQHSTRNYLQAYESVTQYKEKWGPSCMQKKHYQALIESLQTLDEKCRAQKQKLESLREKQDKVMQDITAWSQKSKQQEKRAKEEKLFLEKELENTIKERSMLKEDMKQNEEKYNVEITNIMCELDTLREQISEKKRINKAYKIREEMLNFRINPLKQELEELNISKTIFEENLVQINEVYNQCYEEYQMSNEDKIGKMISRVDLVAEIEEYEELIENLKHHYSSEEIEFIIKHLRSESKEVIKEFGKMRVYCFLRDVCKSLKIKIQKDQDLEASMLSEAEFKMQTHTFDKLEELETIITKRLPILSQDEVIETIQSICESMEIKMSIVAQAQSIMSKADKRFRSIRHKVLEIKQEIDRTENFIRENINTVENFIVPSIEALDGTLNELESSKQEIDVNLEEVSQAIQELEDKIEEVYTEQNDKLNPEIIATLNGQVSMEDCEKELENMHNKIKAFEDELKRKWSQCNYF